MPPAAPGGLAFVPLLFLIFSSIRRLDEKQASIDCYGPYKVKAYRLVLVSSVVRELVCVGQKLRMQVLAGNFSMF